MIRKEITPATVACFLAGIGLELLIARRSPMPEHPVLATAEAAYLGLVIAFMFAVGLCAIRRAVSFFIRRQLRRSGRCPNCRHERGKVATSMCAECGWSSKDESDLRMAPVTRSDAMVGLALIFGVPAGVLVHITILAFGAYLD